jgi:Flp pilus assembly secretin CpaC
MAGSVPVLGVLFSSKSFPENVPDLAIIVTPHCASGAARRRGQDTGRR